MRVALVKPPALGSAVRGIGFYTQNLVESLQKIKNLNVVLVDYSLNTLSQRNFDIVHYPFFDPFFLTLPPIRFAKTVVTVHDLTPIVLYQKFPRGVRGEIKWLIQKNLVKFTSKIITDSLSSKNDIVLHLGISPKKVDVIYASQGNEFQVLTNKKFLSELGQRYNLKSPFLLYVGDVNVNKNLVGLLNAFAHLKSKIKSPLQLVLVGKSFLNEDLPEVKTILDSLNSLGLIENVLILGYVPTEDLVGLYNLAECYVQPSIYEGFGLPIVEAMACGCPVVCGHNSSLPELAGDAGIYAQVSDPVDFANKINYVLDLLPAARKNLKNKLLYQASNFSWDKTASQMKDVYEKILARN